jgi:hypothetical protein
LLPSLLLLLLQWRLSFWWMAAGSDLDSDAVFVSGPYGMGYPKV